jgi:hypothetical protein
MRTRYTFLADGEPVTLPTSWEPLALTEGTPIMFPEEDAGHDRYLTLNPTVK